MGQRVEETVEGDEEIRLDRFLVIDYLKY